MVYGEPKLSLGRFLVSVLDVFPVVGEVAVEYKSLTVTGTGYVECWEVPEDELWMVYKMSFTSAEAALRIVTGKHPKQKLKTYLNST